MIRECKIEYIWNVRALNKVDTLANSESEMNKMNWELLLKSVVRWKQEGAIITEKESSFFFSGCETAQNSVGISVTAINGKNRYLD